MISASGVVSMQGRGEVTVLARYLDKVSTTQITFLTNRRTSSGRILRKKPKSISLCSPNSSSFKFSLRNSAAIPTSFAARRWI